MEDDVIHQMLLRWGGGWTITEMVAGLRESEAMDIFVHFARPLFPSFTLRRRLKRLQRRGKVTSTRLAVGLFEWRAIPEEHPVADSTLIAKQIPKEPQ
jgi:hypothetical protein